MTVTITGTNDQPTITVVDVTGGVTEDTTVADNPNTAGTVETGFYLVESGSVTFAEVDDTDILSSVVALQGTPVASTGASVSTSLATALGDTGTLKLAQTGTNDGTIGWSFALDNSLVQYLAKDETVTATYRITLTDDSGAANASRTQDVTVTITGTNDQPTAVGMLSAVSQADSTVVSIATALSFTDKDSNNLFTYSVTALPSGLSINSSTGEISGTLAHDASQGGTGGVHSVVVTATDSESVAVTQSFSFTVTNPAPVAHADTGAVAENGTLSVSAPNGVILSGSVGGGTDTDVDGDTLTVIGVKAGTAADVAAVGTSNVASALVGTYGHLTLNSDGRYSYVAATAAADALGKNVTAADTFSYAISDGNGGSSFSTLTVTVTGVNDAPTAEGTLSAVTQADSTVVSIATASSFGDKDSNNVFSYSATNLPSGLSINSSIGIITGTLAHNASQGGTGGVHSVVVTATDSESVAVTQSFSFTVTNPAPVAHADTGTVAENSMLSVSAANGVILSGSVAGGRDTDVDGETLVVIGVKAGTSADVTAVGTSNVGTSLVGTYGYLTLGADGSYGYVADTAAADALGKSVTGTDTFSYAISDGNGGRSFSTLTVAVTGTNDAPTLGIVTAGTIVEVDQSSTTTDAGLNGTLVGSDVDVETLTYGISVGSVVGTTVTKAGTYGTVTLDSSTGAYSYAKNARAIEALDVNESGTDIFTFTVMDGDGALVTQSYSVTVTGSDDAPTLAAVTSGTIAEVDQSSSTTDAGLSGTLVGSDVDVETLRYGISGGSVVGTAVTKAGTYGTVTLDSSTGAYSYAKNSGVIEALEVNESGTDTFTFTVTDGDGAQATQSYTVKVTGANDRPVTTNDTITINEDTATVLVVTDFGTYSDAGTTPLATVQITSLPTNGLLQYNDAVNGWVAVTLNQEITKEVIDSGNLRFMPGSNEYGNNYAAIGFKVSDGSAYSATASTLTIHVNALNDAPVSTNDAISTQENTPKVVAITDFGNYSDVEGSALSSVIITSLPHNGALEYFDTTLTVPAWRAVTSLQSVSRADLDAGLLRFVPASNEYGTEYATIGFAVSDGAALSSSYTLRVEVLPASDAPLRTDEDVALPLTINDISGYSNTSASKIVEVQITALASAGHLEYFNISDWVGVTLNQIISKSAIEAGKLRFVPASNEFGDDYATVSFTVSDGTTFSATPSTFTVHVTPVNDAPVSTNDSITTNEDAAAVLSLDDFGSYSDVEGSPLAKVLFTTLASKGVLQYNSGTATVPNWVAVTVAQEFSKDAIEAGKLRFMPASNEYGDAYATIDFKVSEGDLWSDSSYTLTIDFKAINDLPSSTNSTISTDEDSAKVLAVTDFGTYSDVESSSLSSVRITSIASNGEVQYNIATVAMPHWVAVTAGDSITKEDIDAGKLRFMPDSNENGNNYAVLGYQVSDGTDYSVDSYSMTVHVTPVNDPPTATDDRITTNEDSVKVLLLGDVGSYGDVEGTALAKVQITTLAANGELQYNNGTADAPQWIAVTAWQPMTRTDIEAGKLRFVPDVNGNGDNYADFGYKVSDGELWSAQGYHLTVDVLPVNDAPVTTNSTVTTDEDSIKALALSDFGGYSDVEGSPFAVVKITSLPTNGVLQHNDGTPDAPHWVAVLQDDEIGRETIESGNLRFVPDSNEYGQPYTTIGFKVSDGAAYSFDAYSLTVKVTPVNDLPTSSNDTVTTEENQSIILSVTDFGNYADEERSPLAAVTITGLPNNGGVQYNHGTSTVPQWESVAPDQLISRTDIDAGNLRFVPESHVNGSPYTAIGFTVNDGEGDSAAAYRLTVNVTPLDNSALVTNEDTLLPLTIEDFSRSSEVAGINIASITIATLSADGTLEYFELLAWRSVAAGDVISKDAIDAGNLRFVPDSNEYGASYASIGFSVSDGISNNPAIFTLPIAVTAVNDLPQSTDDSVSTAEDATKVLSLTDFGAYSDVENTLLAEVKIISLATNGKLQYNSGTADAPQWITVTLNQAITRAEIETGKLRFVPDLNEYGEHYAEVGFKVSDGSDYSLDAWTLVVHVTPVNDLPTTTDSDTFMTNEDTADSLKLSDFGTYNDVEGAALTAVKITALPGHGELQYNSGTTDRPLWLVVAEGQSLVRADIEASKLRFAPGYNENGDNYTTFGVTVFDGTDYSAAPSTITVNVIPVNDAPLSTNDSITTDEDVPMVLALDDFGSYSDIENTPLAKVQITMLASNGALQYNNGSEWVAVTLNREITAAEITAGKLRFVPDSNENGEPYATIGFNVSDGSDYSSEFYTLTVGVRPLNDPPISTDDSAVMAEDTPKLLTMADFGVYSDIEQSQLASVTIATLPGHGELQYNQGSEALPDWVVVEQGKPISRADLDAAKLRFVPAHNEKGSPYTTIQFAVSDGEDNSVETYTLTLHVATVNDAPTVQAATANAMVVEAGGVNNAVAGNAEATVQLTKGDVDGTASYNHTALLNAGWHTNDSGASYTKVGAYGSATLTTATDSVSYHLDDSRSSTQWLVAGQQVHDCFAVSVQDDATPAATAMVAAVFAITGTNDAPVAAPKAFSVTEDVVSPETIGTLNSSDADAAHTATYKLNASIAGLSLNADGSYEFNPSDAAYHHLNNGDKQIVVAHYTVTDDQAATATSTLTMTVNGRNDLFLSIDDITVNESAGIGTFTITRSGNTAVATSVHYATSDGTAKAADYSASSGNLAFAIDEITKTVTVPILDDAIYEGSEMFNIALSSAPVGTTISKSFATATIKDNETSTSTTTTGSTNGGATPDPAQQIFIALSGKGDISEGSNAIFTATLSGTTTTATEISLSAGAAGDSATLDKDYSSTFSAYYFVTGADNQQEMIPLTLNNNKLQLPAGVMKFIISDPTLGDNKYEGAERFTLTATLPDGQSAIARSTILDDGSGQVYNEQGVVDPTVKGDDDGYLIIPDVTVNEYSPADVARYAVFRLSATSNYSFTLALQDGGIDSDGNAYEGDAIATATSDGTSTIDYVNALQLYNGTKWVDYTTGAPVNVPKGGTVLLARVKIVNDDVYEGSHAFTIIATPSGGRDAVSARGILGDFGTGAIFNDSGAEERNLKKDDDRTIQVDSPIVNEGSHYSLFTITGKPNTPVALSIQADSSATSKDATTIIPPNTPLLQFWNGTAWQTCDETNGSNAALPTSTTELATLYVRVDISTEQGAARDTAKDFALQVKDIGTSTKSVGVASIHDDGTGVIYLFRNSATGSADKDSNGAYAGTSTDNLDDDFDLDGITPTTEEALATLAASQGIGSADLGDLNGDGIQDALQNALATLAWRTTEDFAAGNDGTLTDSKAIISINVTESDSSDTVSDTAQLLDISVAKYSDIDAAALVTTTTVDAVNADGLATKTVTEAYSDSQGGATMIREVVETTHTDGSVTKTVNNTVTLADNSTVTTPWDPIRFEVAGKDNALLPDILPRDGTQVRILIDVRTSGLTKSDANAYIKFVPQVAIDAAKLVKPLTDLHGTEISSEGWYDFTRLDQNSLNDGARFICEGDTIVAIELIITDNAFGDSDPASGRVYDPGVMVKVTTTVTDDPVTPLYTADQTPGKVDFYGVTTGGVALKAWHNPITGDYFYAPAGIPLPYECYEPLSTDLGRVLEAGKGVFDVHLYLNSAGDTQIMGESAAAALGLLSKGYTDMGAMFASANATTLDHVAPTVASFTPNDGATAAPVKNDVILTFSEAITKGSAGAIVIHRDSAGGEVVSATVSVSGNTLTINPNDDLAHNTHYFVTLDDGSVVDLAGNNYTGTSNYDFWTDSLGADPYAGVESSHGNTGTVLGGIAALGVIAWLVL
ncbi:MAG: Ig-like domain-containing protein [Chlorobiaceae bacterium]